MKRFAALLAVLLALPAYAAYPEKPIRWILDVAAGSTSDIIARMIGAKMSESMGQPIIIDPRPGATGAIAYGAAAAAPADGYTIVMITTTLAQTVAAKPEQRALLTNLVPVAPIMTTGSVILVRPEFPAKDYAGFVSYWRSKKDLGGLSYGSVGNGSTAHLAGEYMANTLGLPGVHVPYGGSAPALLDVIAGRVDFVVINVPASMPHLKVNRLRPIAVVSKNRSAVLPDVPTLVEGGGPPVSFSGWFGVATGAKVPEGIVRRLNEELAKAVASPDIRARLLELGGDPVAMKPEVFRQFVNEDVESWSRLMKTIGVKPQ